MMQYKELDPLLHSQLRLAVMSLLMSVEEADFSFLQEKTQATSGNLSIQITKLKEGGYLTVTKKFRKNYPVTLCKITPLGKQRFAEYVKALKEYLYPDQK